MASQKKLCVRSDGSFKVMQIADLQEIPAISPDTLKLMNAALDREKPDLVVFTGDQIKGYGITFRGGDRKNAAAAARAPENTPAMVKKIGKTTYKVHVHFSNTSTETMSDKIKRMLKNEIQQM